MRKSWQANLRDVTDKACKILDVIYQMCQTPWRKFESLSSVYLSGFLAFYLREREREKERERDNLNQDGLLPSTPFFMEISEYRTFINDVTQI